MCLDGQSSVLWGWERFFTELSIFLNTAERQRETANEAYSQYVLECLQTSLMSLSAIADILQQTNGNSQVQIVSAQYHAEITELTVCIREISSQWERHIDDQVVRDVSTSYSTPLTTVSRVGRPRFDIRREQIEHLASLSFSWTQIAGMHALYLKKYTVS